MDKNLSDKFHEEIWKRYGKMSDQLQMIFIKLAHKFWHEDRPLKEDEKIIAIFHL